MTGTPISVWPGDTPLGRIVSTRPWTFSTGVNSTELNGYGDGRQDNQQGRLANGEAAPEEEARRNCQRDTEDHPVSSHQGCAVRIDSRVGRNSIQAKAKALITGAPTRPATLLWFRGPRLTSQRRMTRPATATAAWSIQGISTTGTGSTLPCHAGGAGQACRSVKVGYIVSGERVPGSPVSGQEAPETCRSVPTIGGESAVNRSRNTATGVPSRFSDSLRLSQGRT